MVGEVVYVVYDLCFVGLCGCVVYVFVECDLYVCGFVLEWFDYEFGVVEEVEVGLVQVIE